MCWHTLHTGKNFTSKSLTTTSKYKIGSVVIQWGQHSACTMLIYLSSLEWHLLAGDIPVLQKHTEINSISLHMFHLSIFMVLNTCYLDLWSPPVNSEAFDLLSLDLHKWHACTCSRSFGMQYTCNSYLLPESRLWSGDYGHRQFGREMPPEDGFAFRWTRHQQETRNH